ncbi:uracil-DNA glycosylase-like protein [Phycomyces nitens]|nr:uracil-DNA glycosylase-like protein [Phycomyces nitens]
MVNKRRTTGHYSPYFKQDKNVDLPELKDNIGENLRVLFVGINPGIMSSTRGHHFAGPTNHFWPCLSDSGLVDKPLTYKDDQRLPKDYGLGITSLTSRPTRSASELTKAEQMVGIPVLNQKIRKYKPKVVCFVGKGIYEIYMGEKCKSLGLQPNTIKWDKGGSKVFVMPSTSGIVSAYKKSDKLRFFKDLCSVVEQI